MISRKSWRDSTWPDARTIRPRYPLPVAARETCKSSPFSHFSVEEGARARAGVTPSWLFHGFYTSLTIAARFVFPRGCTLRSFSPFHRRPVLAALRLSSYLPTPARLRLPSFLPTFFSLPPPTRLLFTTLTRSGIMVRELIRCGAREPRETPIN